MSIALPVEGVVDHDALRRPDDAVGTGLERSCESAGVRVDEAGLGVEAVSPFGRQRPIGLEMVQLPRTEVWNEHGPDISPAIGIRVEFDVVDRLAIFHVAVQEDAEGGCGMAVDDELNAPVPDNGAVGERIVELHRRVRAGHVDAGSGEQRGDG